MALPIVDLFAGCGGLSLGLERAGFKPVFVNELHPNAMSTYLLNRPHLDLGRPKNNANDILEITQKPGELDALASRLQAEHGEIGLVVGGPPCQGFSGIGHRRSFDIKKEDIPSNYLYREMAKVIEAVAPRAFVFENVRGLLNSKWTPEGEKGEIWEDVQKAFRSIKVKIGGSEYGYAISSQLVQAKQYGVPQNRPRIIMIGIRSDITFDNARSKVANGLIPEPTNDWPDLIDYLGDLVDNDWVPGGSTERYVVEPQNQWQLGLRTLPGGEVLGVGARLTDQEYSNHDPAIIEKFRYMIANGGAIPESMKTKKFAQRVLPARWDERGPTITATSLADDYVHFALPRVPTVREWARLQTFPDWYQFSGRRTTGGRRRAGDPSIGDWSRDLPKYTQIGNAVPVKLAEAIGRHLIEIIS